MTELSNTIEAIVKEEVKNHPESFREPLIGYASAQDPLYDTLSFIIGNIQLHPTELLAAAKTVVVYFIPYSLEIIAKIRGQKVIVPEWSENYTLANSLLQTIGSRLAKKLQSLGIMAVQEPPTNSYDPIQLTARWSHKSSAVIAGIGTFGLNHLLITPSGTAGRLGSIVIDAEIAPTKRPTNSYCLYYQAGTCKVCVEKCPTGALTAGSFDRFRCNAYLDGKNVHELQQGCGMCSSGPCSAKGFC